jgi:hypothetical protein
MSKNLDAFLARFKDDLGIVTTGPFAEALTKEKPKILRLLREGAKEMHPGLAKVESKYIGTGDEDRMEWPRSQVLMSKWDEQLRTFSKPHLKPKRKGFTSLDKHIQRLIANGFDVPFQQSQSFEFDKVGLDLSKSSGLPKLDRKRDHVEAAGLYWDKIEGDKDTPAYALLAGLKTETAPPNVTKPRVFLLNPISEWYGQIKYLRDSIKRTGSKCIDGSLRNFSLYYANFDILHKFVAKQIANATCCVVLDATQFGANITSLEFEQVLRWATRYERTNGIEHLVEYSVNAPILAYDGLHERKGGLADGHDYTNLGDGIIMDWESWDVWDQLKLASRISGSLGNGDDKAFFFKTLIGQNELKRFTALADRQFSSEKTWVERDCLWFSKMFWCTEYWCSSIALTYNRLKFLRRVRIAGEVEFKAYVAVRTTMNFEYIKNHPLASKFRDIVRRCDKYPIETLDDAQIQNAVAAYTRENTWLTDLGFKDIVRDIQNKSFYAVG